MILYKEEVRLSEEPSSELMNRFVKRHTVGRSTSGRSFFYLTEADGQTLTFCHLAELGAEPEKAARDYLKKMGVRYARIQRSEIGVNELAAAIRMGNIADYCPELTDVFREFSLMPYIAEPFDAVIAELVSEGPRTLPAAIRSVSRLHSRSLAEEVKRIWQGAGQPFRGHPVLYSITSQSRKKCEDMLDVLMASLQAAGRLPANRACAIRPLHFPMPPQVLKDLYTSQSGAVVVIDLFHDAVPEKRRRPVSPMAELMDEEHEPDPELTLRLALRLAELRRDEVLTVFLLSADAQNRLPERLPVVPLSDDYLTRAEAKRQISSLAKKAGFPEKEAQDCLPAEQKQFSETEIGALFTQWKEQYLRTQAFPQYAEFLRPAEESEPVRTAQSELESLIGLREVKKVIRQVTDYAAMQKLYRERGLKTEPPRLHMVFTGNPGTAKTTVARLVARILAETGVLSKGRLIEVGRGDLVGKYAGWTANLVRAKFEEADGSVLFIDEAYSLLDGHEKQFGDEAINTIVQEMENRRDSTVVIFAGYREPMEEFLDRNIGLRSRISFTVHFPDYSEEELMQILRLTVDSRGRTLSSDAEEKLRTVFRASMSEEQFGNGRFVRNLTEQAMLAQASRLAALPRETLTDEMLLQLRAEDFPEPQTAEEAEPARRIGFCA